MSTLGIPGMLESDPETIDLSEIDISHIDLWKQDKKWGFFKRLRDEAPVHYCKSSEYGPFWSVTRFEDILEVEKNWEILGLKNFNKNKIINRGEFAIIVDYFLKPFESFKIDFKGGIIYNE